MKRQKEEIFLYDKYNVNKLGGGRVLSTKFLIRKIFACLAASIAT